MTALQDWLSNQPVNPRNLKSLICDALRTLTPEEPAKIDEPQLLRRGLERC